METLNELKEKAKALTELIEVLQNDLENAKFSLECVEEKIFHYKKYVEQMEKQEYNKSILKWIHGKDEIYTIDSYSGIVCPSLNLFHYPEGHKPTGSNAEIVNLLKKGNYKMLTFESVFVSSGAWGHCEIQFTLHEKY